MTKKNDDNLITAIAVIAIIALIVLGVSAFLKPAVIFQYNQRGSIGGHPGTLNSASDSGATFTFDEYGTVNFGANGYGENDKVSVQLSQEYGRFFCSVSSCGGLSNWVSKYGTVTPKGVTATPTPTPTPSSGMSQIHVGRTSPSGVEVTNIGTITISGNGVSQSYPPSTVAYTIDIPVGVYTVSSDTPSGYTLSYLVTTSTSLASITGVMSEFVNGNTVTIQTQDGMATNIWFMYTPDTPGSGLGTGNLPSVSPTYILGGLAVFIIIVLFISGKKGKK